MAPDAALDRQVRRADEDRWLASRFAPEAARARLIAIYALHHEIARTAEIVSEPAIGDIRLQWWREALAEALEGRAPRAHPVLAALVAVQRETPLPEALLFGLVDARRRDLDAAPLENWAALERYVDATAGAVVRLGLAICGGDGAKHDGMATAAGRAWGYCGLLRAAAHLRARGRSVLPADHPDPHAMLARAQAAHADAQRLSRTLPSASFAAIGYVALVPAYLRALERGRTDTNLLARQLRLLGASATGRL
jgi:phytoene synthase